MNVLGVFSPRSDIRDREADLDARLTRVRQKVTGDDHCESVPVDIEFPEKFTEQCKHLTRGGTIHWRDFYSNPEEGIYSLHCRMNEGTLIRNHMHPGFDEYIYVVHGQLINWSRNQHRGEVIMPPEKKKTFGHRFWKGNDVNGWYHIPAGEQHQLQATRNDTHFVCKFVKTPDP